MVKKLTITALLSFSLLAKAQITEGFENSMLDTVKLLNGSDGLRMHYFNTGEMTFPVKWDTTYKYWASGWAMSKIIDNTIENPNFTKHLYSAAPGFGVENGNGKAFMVGQSGSFFFLQRRNSGDFPLKGFYVSNSTYAYNSMKFGDNFAKKFTPADYDTFVLSVKVYTKDSFIAEKRVYLADFRLGINSYIASNWIEVIMPLSGDSITFTLESSDNGDFGMNTPAYFALDEITLIGPASVKKIPSQNVLVYPNPATDQLNFKNIPVSISKASCIDALGRKLELTLNSQGSANVSHLKSGIYWVELQDIKGVTYRSSFIKN